MTVNVRFTGGTTTALEIIKTRAGIEQERKRITDGQVETFGLDGSTTVIVREVPADWPLDPDTGGQRHGDLDHGKGV